VHNGERRRSTQEGRRRSVEERDQLGSAYMRGCARGVGAIHKVLDGGTRSGHDNDGAGLGGHARAGV
jgi:hypothetical protein